MKSPEERLQLIVESGLCIGCGLCESVAGPDRIRMDWATNGYQYPRPQQSLDHEIVDTIYQICPGTRVEGLPEALAVGATEDFVWGPYREVVRAYAADPEVRHIGSTGGVLTALGIYLLESGRVDFILHVSASESRPTCGERHLSFNRADVLRAAGSRYGPAAPLVDFPELLELGRPFAFIAKPCDVSALRNYAKMDARVDELCKYMLVMVCGGYGEPSFTNEFIDGMGIEPAELVNFRYRGFGCPGPTRAETRDGRVVEKTCLDYWGEGESSWGLPFRCKICPDGIGEAADMAVADTWLGGSPTWESQVTDPGTNVIIVRTQAGAELVQAAVTDGALVQEREIDIRDMDEYQPHQVRKKYQAGARNAGLRAASGIELQTRRLRIRELGLECDFSDNLAEARGTRRRVHAQANEDRRWEDDP